MPAGTKNEGRAESVPSPVTADVWTRHLAGEVGIGITCVDDRGLCIWGAIDVDVYTLDLVELAKRVRRLNLPLIVVRTKSGGAHLLLFLSSPAPASALRMALRRWARSLRYPDSEIFPKQDDVPDDGFGSWLNMPYQGGERSLRYALDPETGIALTPVEFLDLAYEIAVDPDDLSSLRAGAEALAPAAGSTGDPDDDPDMPGVPPCLGILLRQDTIQGSRNEVLFNAAIYLRQSDPTNAERRAMEVARGFHPPVADREARSTILSAIKRPYSYRCRNAPLTAVCDRVTCLTRAHGVGARGGTTRRGPELGMGTLCKLLTVPPTWIWDVNGARVELTTEQLLNQKQFLVRVFEETNVMGASVRPSDWSRLVARAAAEAPQMMPPPDGTAQGIIWVQLGRFCTGRAQARNVDELLLGKPFTHDGRTFFCASDFLAYCHQQRVPTTEKKLYVWLHDRGLQHGMLELKGKEVPVWSVPEFPTQTEPYDVPRDPQAGAAF